MGDCLQPRFCGVCAMVQGTYLSTHATRLQSNSRQVEGWIGHTRAQGCCSCRVVVIGAPHTHGHPLKHDTVQSHSI